jgi:hypothetical protein
MIPIALSRQLKKANREKKRFRHNLTCFIPIHYLNTQEAWNILISFGSGIIVETLLGSTDDRCKDPKSIEFA